MSRIIIDIPDSYSRVEGVIEIFDGLYGGKLPYQQFSLDRTLVPGDQIKIVFKDDGN